VREEPYTTGETVTLRPYGRGTVVKILAPSGLYLQKVTEGNFDLWLAEPGEWFVQWDDSEQEIYRVVDPAPVEDFDLVDVQPVSLTTSFKTANP